ncbi:condensation domain-containing protein, partial [Paludibacterium sp.]|uniref:condensation domain-containing protein n=1 Tax=Paludibacterium sp. TaxID=1917523 RepID=UPI0025DEDDAC
MNPHDSLEAVPLSVAQLGIWVAQQLDPQSPIFNIAEYLDIPGPLDPDRLARAVRAVVLASDALHQRFSPGAEGPRGRIEAIDDYRLPCLDLSHESDPIAAARQWMQRDVEHVADLAHGPLFALTLLRLGDAHHLLYARAHHIVNDGFGGALFFRQIAEVYGLLATGDAQDFAPAGCWRDLIASENAYRESARFPKDRAYWLEQLQGLDTAATLSGKPPGRPGPVVEAAAALPRAEATALLQWGQAHGTSLAQIVTAAAGYYLAALTGQRDILLGVPVTARTGAKMRHIVGMVANILPLRLSIAPGDSLAALAQQTTRRMRELLRHQSYRREDLRHDLGLSPEAPELYGLTVNVNAFAYDLAFAGTPAHVYNLGSRPVNDLQLVLFDNLDEADVRIKLFGKAAHYTTAEVHAHLRRFLALLSRWHTLAPDTRLEELDLLSDAERHAVVELPNQTRAAIAPQPLHALFEASAQGRPEALALSGHTL